MKKHTIVSLLVNDNSSMIGLEEESKPVREVMKANFGVEYTEDITEGGAANCRLTGESFYASKDRNMTREELGSKQTDERISKVEDY